MWFQVKLWTLLIVGLFALARIMIMIPDELDPFVLLALVIGLLVWLLRRQRNTPPYS